MDPEHCHATPGCDDDCDCACDPCRWARDVEDAGTYEATIAHRDAKIAELTLRLERVCDAGRRLNDANAYDLAMRVQAEDERDDAVRIARDLLTWARASGVQESAVIDAEARLARVTARRNAP